MPIVISSQDLDFIRRVDDLGRRGLDQKAIAEELGLKDRHALNGRLNSMGYRLAAENRVRFSANGERLVDLIERGDLIGNSAALAGVTA